MKSLSLLLIPIALTCGSLAAAQKNPAAKR
jgi:hypothetical protein